MVKLEEYMDIFRLQEGGHSISSISRMTGKDRKTIRKYLQGGKSRPPQMKPRQHRAGKLSVYEGYILDLLNRHHGEYIPATVIYEKLIARGYRGSLSLVQKWVGRYKKTRLPEVVIRYETGPGEQAQVDWGEKKIKDIKTGITRKVYIFGMTLSYSRMRFVHFVERADMYHFMYCHQLAFEYFGGIPQEILYDQNRCVVLKPGWERVEFNRRFLDFACHYHFHPRLCKPYRPQTKGKVENLIKYVKQSFLSTQETPTVKVLNRRKHHWLAKVNNKVHSTTQEIPFKRLEAEELQPMASFGSYDVCYYESRKVFNDSTISFQGCRYSVPPEYIGKTVAVKHRPGIDRIEVYDQEKPITQHRTDSSQRYVIKRSHRHRIWKVWRDQKHLYYQKAAEQHTRNHPLSIYEEVSALSARADREVSHG